jgi:Spy/CpxP family protein refolding chaperone
MKKTLITLALGSALALSSAYAYGGGSCDQKGSYGKNKSAKECGSHTKQRGGDCFKNLMRGLWQLELSDEQWTQIKTAMLEMKIDNLAAKEDTKLESFLNEGTFDKKAYVAQKQKMMQIKIENEAAAVEKIVKVLDASQLEALKENLQTPAGEFKKQQRKSCK